MSRTLIGLSKTRWQNSMPVTDDRVLPPVSTFACSSSTTSKALRLNEAWRCRHSLSLQQFLEIKLTEDVPDHSSMTRIRDRYSLEVTENVFAFVLKLAADNRLISATTVGVDSTQLEANAAMKSIVRKDTGEDWKYYLRRLMLAKGLIDEDDQPSDEELVRFDRARQGKKGSNKEWESPTDEDAGIEDWFVRNRTAAPVELAWLSTFFVCGAGRGGLAFGLPLVGVRPGGTCGVIRGAPLSAAADRRKADLRRHRPR